MTDTLPSRTGARGGALIRADVLHVRERLACCATSLPTTSAWRSWSYWRRLHATDGGAAGIGAAYGGLFALLAADEAELSTDPLIGDAWQNHLLDRLLETETPFRPEGPA